MITSLNKKRIFFLTFMIFSITSLIVFSDFVSDPIIQYNQTGSPYISKGGTPVGNSDDLNVLGEGLTYDIPESWDNDINVTMFHAYFDGWSTTVNCSGAIAEGWSDCVGGEATMFFRAVASSGSHNATSTQYLEGNNIDTDNATWITKCLDLSSYSKAYVTFWYNKTSTNAANERQFILVNRTGAGTLTSIWDSTTSVAAWTYRELNITDYITSSTCIRYMPGAASGAGEQLRLDDFKIIGTQQLYGFEAWHNSSQIADGNINFINATINFTSNVSDAYSLQIYDWLNSQWSTTNCDSGAVSANTPTRWWCNVTTNPMNYNSSDRTVRIKINSTVDNDVSLLKEDYIQYYVGYPSYLEVNQTNPDPNPSSPLNVIQNQTFNVNATIVCKNGPCGEVNGTVRYNLTSSNPDVPVNITPGDKPFYIKESPANAMKSCGTMYSGDSCQLNWTINATGNVNSQWKIGVLFNSSYIDIQNNNTLNATVSIISCTEDFILQWSSIKFGLLNPNTGPHEAPGNPNGDYNITVNSGSCNLDFYISGTDLVNTTLNSNIGVGNVTWSNASNNYSSSYNLSTSPATVKLNVPKNTNVTTWYWINVPSVYAGYYNGNITITGVKNG